MAEQDELYDENGRSYHTYQRGLYWLPHDDVRASIVYLTALAVYPSKLTLV